MYIERIKVWNYRALRECDVKFNRGMNIIVGDNESGKSTLLECISLALTGQLNGRSAQSELHPLLFNSNAVSEYIQSHKDGKPKPPPEIVIELYFPDSPELAALRGTNNTEKSNCPGVKFIVDFNEEYDDEYSLYVKDPDDIRVVPIEYYRIQWYSFAFNPITSRSIPISPVTIDPTRITNVFGASKYILDLVRDALDEKERVQLSLSYRKMRHTFLEDNSVKKINEELEKRKGVLSDKVMTVSLDTTSRGSWEAGIMPYLDDIPISLIGKGEQNTVKIKLALDNNSNAHLFLFEEPENHLSHSRLNQLIDYISDKSGDRQSFITTHSSFVLNKIGVNSVILFTPSSSARLTALTPDTFDYFKKLPGHDTLRLILSRRSILVEGPSDELIVQKAFLQTHGAMPLAKGIDVITVKSLAFKRFLEIARLLKIRVDVITDNDRDVESVKEKYKDYDKEDFIGVHYDDDVEYRTLEPQLLKANGLKHLNKILGTAFKSEDQLLAYMERNKTDVALRIFDSSERLVVPAYIENAIKQ